jgi:hypothetical protein
MNNLAIYTGVRKPTLARFIRKYNLDIDKLTQAVMKYKNIRKDLAAAVSGYDNNEIALDIAQKFHVNEGIRADEFFISKVGRSVLQIIKRNGGQFNREQVENLLDTLNTHDLKWARQMDMVAISVGLDISKYDTYNEQLPDMLDAIERLYNQYRGNIKESFVVTKQTIMEMVNKAGSHDITKSETDSPKRLIINVPQFEYLLNQILNPLNTSVALSEGVLDDTYTFEVYSSRMKKFNDFLKEYPSFKITKLKRDGDYLYITVTNSGRFTDWEPIVKFYKEQIKI